MLVSDTQQSESAIFQYMETSQVSIDSWMEDVVHIYKGILFSHLKEQNWIIFEMWMDLESVRQSEVSQKKKNKYHKWKISIIYYII